MILHPAPSAFPGSFLGEMSDPKGMSGMHMPAGSRASLDDAHVTLQPAYGLPPSEGRAGLLSGCRFGNVDNTLPPSMLMALPPSGPGANEQTGMLRFLSSLHQEGRSDLALVGQGGTPQHDAIAHLLATGEPRQFRHGDVEGAAWVEHHDGQPCLCFDLQSTSGLSATHMVRLHQVSMDAPAPQIINDMAEIHRMASQFRSDTMTSPGQQPGSVGGGGVAFACADGTSQAGAALWLFNAYQRHHGTMEVVNGRQQASLIDAQRMGHVATDRRSYDTQFQAFCHEGRDLLGAGFGMGCPATVAACADLLYARAMQLLAPWMLGDHGGLDEKAGAPLHGSTADLRPGAPPVPPRPAPPRPAPPLPPRMPLSAGHAGAEPPAQPTQIATAAQPRRAPPALPPEAQAEPRTQDTSSTTARTAPRRPAPPPPRDNNTAKASEAPETPEALETSHASTASMTEAQATPLVPHRPAPPPAQAKAKTTAQESAQARKTPPVPPPKPAKAAAAAPSRPVPAPSGQPAAAAAAGDARAQASPSSLTDEAATSPPVSHPIPPAPPLPSAAPARSAKPPVAAKPNRATRPARATPRPLQPPPMPPKAKSVAPGTTPFDPAAVPTVPTLADLHSAPVPPEASPPAAQRRPSTANELAFETAFNDLAEQVLGDEALTPQLPGAGRLDAPTLSKAQEAEFDDLAEQLLTTQMPAAPAMALSADEEAKALEAAFNELVEELEQTYETPQKMKGRGGSSEVVGGNLNPYEEINPEAMRPSTPPAYASEPPPYTAPALQPRAALPTSAPVAATPATSAGRPATERPLETSGPTVPAKDTTPLRAVQDTSLSNAARWKAKEAGNAIMGATVDEMVAVLAERPSLGQRMRGFLGRQAVEPGGADAFLALASGRLGGSLTELGALFQPSEPGLSKVEIRRQRSAFVVEQLMDKFQESLSRLDPAARDRVLGRIQAENDPALMAMQRSHDQSVLFLRQHPTASNVTTAVLQQSVFTQGVVLKALKRLGNDDDSSA